MRAVVAAALANVRPSHLPDREVAEAWKEEAGNFEPRRESPSSSNLTFPRNVLWTSELPIPIVRASWGQEKA